ncbi:MICOS complex subunit MIC19 [Acipenser ruthenus]|uniref:MICOS complex subunit MIC19 n=1 Tax=Acipenser ruthenus TaxID=7906 RepID=A0A444U8P9_ACIRT|nr:MICOS complex subunit MIC19 [Acipenser ruthenus]
MHHKILGWLIVCIAAVTGLIGTCYKNCRSQVSYLQLKFWRKYIEKEKEQFDCYATKYATKLADRNLKSFFENTEPEAFPFPSHRSWEEISSLYTFCKSEQYYSTLQRTVEKGNKDKDDEMRCALDFVDGAKQLEEKDRDLRKQDAYYKEQLARLEDRSAQFYKVTTEQYQKSVTEVEAKFKRYESHPVCADLQGEILRCYQASNGQTLRCSTLARQYLQCVNNAKQSMLRKGG